MPVVSWLSSPPSESSQLVVSDAVVSPIDAEFLTSSVPTSLASAPVAFA